MLTVTAAPQYFKLNQRITLMLKAIETAKSSKNNEHFILQDKLKSQEMIYKWHIHSCVL